jgi:hypothetical protein
MVTNYIISIGFILLGVWLLYRAYAPRQRARVARSWPVTTARILESVTVENQLRTATGKVALSFSPVVRYTYSVNGTSYEGDRITFAKAGFDFITASNIRDELKQDTKTDVSYNPHNPSESVLRPKSTVGMFSPIPGFFILSVGLILLGVIFWL